MVGLNSVCLYVDGRVFAETDNVVGANNSCHRRRTNAGLGFARLFNIYFYMDYLLYVSFSVLLQIAFFELETV